MIIIYIIVSIIMGLIGKSIGEPKGKAGLGFFLGCVFGILGLILIAVLP